MSQFVTINDETRRMSAKVWNDYEEDDVVLSRPVGDGLAPRINLVPEREFGFCCHRTLDFAARVSRNYDRNSRPDCRSEIEFRLALPVGFAQNDKEG